MTKVIFAALAVTALTAPAGALTLTFDAIPQYGTQFDDDGNITNNPSFEQGVTISSSPFDSGPSWDVNPGTIHLDDAGTDNPSAINFTTGGVFGALGFSLFGLPQESVVAGLNWGLDAQDYEADGVFYYADGTPVGLPVAYDNVVVTGYLNGALVATESFSSGLAGGWASFTLGTGFGTIDQLTVAAVSPTGTIGGHPIECTTYPCGHFELDSLTLTVAPVPLPAGLPLIAAGMGALALLRRRR